MQLPLAFPVELFELHRFALPAAKTLMLRCLSPINTGRSVSRGRMNLKQLPPGASRNPPVGECGRAVQPRRFLTLVVEGAALGVPEIDSAVYSAFRSSVGKLALQLPDRLPDEEKLAQIRAVCASSKAIAKPAKPSCATAPPIGARWFSFLFRELLKSLGIDSSLANADSCAQDGGVVSAEHIEELRGQMESFLHPCRRELSPGRGVTVPTADHYHGQRQCGRAARRRQRHRAPAGIMASGGKGFIVLFRLSCLNMINQRFGPEAVEDCLMAVAAFLTRACTPTTPSFTGAILRCWPFCKAAPTSRFSPRSWSESPCRTAKPASTSADAPPCCAFPSPST